MPNIQGIIGYAVPGAYSISKTRAGAVSLPGSPTVVCVLGSRAHTEERLVARALGDGQDGEPIGFTYDGGPDGRHFQLSKTDIIVGSVELFLNPVGDGNDVPLARVTGAGDPRWDVDNTYAGTKVVTQDAYEELIAKFPTQNIFMEPFLFLLPVRCPPRLNYYLVDRFLRLPLRLLFLGMVIIVTGKQIGRAHV